MTDAELIARARQGDHAAFGELIDRHRLAVYRAALAAIGSHAEAEDAAQDAFVSAFRRLNSFRGDSSFKTWLLTIAWHHAINRRRSLTRWWRRTAPLEPGDVERLDTASAKGARRSTSSRRPESVEGRSPERETLDAELRRQIAGAIRALSPKLRDALLLAQAGEYTYEEIAAMLGTATGTIKWRVSEARKTVRKQLEARGLTDVG